MSTSAQGTFEVTLTPETSAGDAHDAPLGRLSIEKRFHGDLEATSTGQMLSAPTSIADSAGYVAIEWVRGTLHGRRGAFALQHSGLMARGVPTLTISVVPDSGTDQLAGIAGAMSITIADGQHFYDLAYTLPETA